MWAPRGERPTCCGRTKYEWLYVYGFAHPATGRSLHLILPRVGTDVMTAALDHFARWADPEGKKVLVTLVDNAGWHVSGRLEVPGNVVLHHLPARTPELQPVEAMWPLVREGLANRTFATLDEMDEKLTERCKWLMDNPDVVKGRVGFSWAAAMG